MGEIDPAMAPRTWDLIWATDMEIDQAPRIWDLLLKILEIDQAMAPKIWDLIWATDMEIDPGPRTWDLLLKILEIDQAPRTWDLHPRILVTGLAMAPRIWDLHLKTFRGWRINYAGQRFEPINYLTSFPFYFDWFLLTLKLLQ